MADPKTTLTRGDCIDFPGYSKYVIHYSNDDEVFFTLFTSNAEAKMFKMRPADFHKLMDMTRTEIARREAGRINDAQ